MRIPTIYIQIHEKFRVSTYFNNNIAVMDRVYLKVIVGTGIRSLR